MNIAVDIGGTKTLLATFTADGQIDQTVKFPTDEDYRVFLEQLRESITKLANGETVSAIGMAIPGKLDRTRGVGISFGNLPWQNIPIVEDLQSVFQCPVYIENDANLAGLSEAHLVIDQYKKALYLTISTGIGSGIITNGIIDAALADSESGQMPLWHDNQLQAWESFASGSAIVAKYGKRAADITDEGTWREIVPGFTQGILPLLAVLQPDVVIIGGGAGSHFDHFGELLVEDLKRHETPLVPIPPVIPAQHAEEAVVYGCYQLIQAGNNGPAAQ